MRSQLRSALRAATFAAVAVGAGSSTSDAAESCLKPDKKTCKIPEDCFYKRQIAMKRAFRDAFLSSAMRCAAIAKANGPNPPRGPDGKALNASEILYQEIANHPERVARKLPSCSTRLADPPGWETDASCSYQAKGADGRAVDPDSVNTCSEFLAASRAHEHEHVTNCKAARDGKTSELGGTSGWASKHQATCAGVHWNQGAPKVPDRNDVNDFADEEADAYTTEVWELEDRRAAAIHACTTARADAEAAAKNAKDHAAAIKKLGGVR